MARIRLAEGRLGSRKYNSLACFVNPNFEAVGECLATCTGPDNPPKYPAQTYREFFTWYMTNTFTHYGKLKAVDGEAVEA